MEYTLDWFIDFYEKIPPEKWGTGSLDLTNGKSCALKLIGVTINDINSQTEEILHEGGRALANLLKPLFPSGVTEYRAVYRINDSIGTTHPLFIYPTPDQRILAALYYLKQNEALKEVQQILNTETCVTYY